MDGSGGASRAEGRLSEDRAAAVEVKTEQRQWRR
jgi:hypothetical protein